MAARWRREEDERLRRLYRAGVPVAAIAREIGRSEDAVGARRRALGLASRRVRSWSALEDAMLRRGAALGLPASALARPLRRPVEQVRSRRRQLGLARPGARRYTRAEDEMLRAEWHAGVDVDALARRLGRSADALRLRARQLGLHRPAARRPWSASEDAAVRDGYANGLSCAEIAAGLERTPTAISAHARRLGLATYARRWTTEDDARLRRILQLRSVDDAARLLSRTPEAVRRRARKLGLAALRPDRATRAGARWTDDEDELLTVHPGLNPAVLAALLGRSNHAVVSRLRRLGLRAGRWRSPHHPSPSRDGLTAGERALVERELRDRGSRAIVSLADRLQRPHDAIADVLQFLDTAPRASSCARR